MVPDSRMSSTILFPRQPLNCHGSSDADRLDTSIDAPHDERISAQPSQYVSMTHSINSAIVSPLQPDDDERNISSSNNASYNNSPPKMVFETNETQLTESIENSLPSQKQMHAMDFIGTHLRPQSHCLDNDDSVLTDSYESSGSFAARLDIPKKESPMKTNAAVLSTWQEDIVKPESHEVLIDKDDLGIPISITIFHSTSVDSMEDSVNNNHFMETLNNSGRSSSVDPVDRLNDLNSEILPMEQPVDKSDFISETMVDTSQVPISLTRIKLKDDVDEDELEKSVGVEKQQLFDTQDDVESDEDPIQSSGIATNELIQDYYDELRVTVTDTIKITDLDTMSENEVSSICDQSHESDEPVSEILGLVNATENILRCTDDPIATTEPEKLSDTPLHESLKTIDNLDPHTTIMSSDRQIWKMLQDTDAPAIHLDARSIILLEDDDMLNIAIGPELDGEPNYIDTLLGMDFVLGNGMVIRFNDELIPSFVERSINVDPMDDSKVQSDKKPVRKEDTGPISDYVQRLTSSNNDSSNSSNATNSHINSPASHDFDNTAEALPLKLPVVRSTDATISTAVHSRGSVLALISLKSMITKKWKEIFWSCRDHSCLLIFRSKEDADYWLMNPKDKNRDILIKFQINFQKDFMARSGVRAYKLTEVKSKQYDKRSEPM